MPGTSPSSRAVPSRAELARTSFWLGLVGFGGGVSVLASIHDVAVLRRRWLTEREFANTATVGQMLPGGAAANALALVGLRFHGQAGAAIAYAAHLAPGAALVFALAFAYVRFGVAAPRAKTVLDGFNAAVVGIVASLTLRMVRTAVQRGWQMGVSAMALLLAVGGGASAGEIAALGVVAGLVVDSAQKRARLSRWRRAPRRPSPPVALPDEGEPMPHANEPPRPGGPSVPLAAVAALPALAVAKLGALAALALLFLRTGLGAYGGGFAIIPHLQASLIGAHLVTARQLADAVAIGKLTPGPVLLLATFVGYLLQGPAGALVATAAIFAGPFLLVVALGTFLLRMRSRRPVRAALRGLTPAVVGLMGAAAITLGAGLANGADVAVAAATTLTLVRFRPNPALVLLLGGTARLAMALSGL